MSSMIMIMTMVQETHQRLLWAAHGWMYPCVSVSKQVCVKTSSVGANHMNGSACLDSVWHRDKMQLGNGLLDECRKHSWVKS